MLSAFLWAAHRQVRSTLLIAAAGRAQSAATQVAGLLAQASQQRIAAMRRLSDDPLARAYVQSPSDASLTALSNRAVALHLDNRQDVAIELWVGARRTFVGGTTDSAPTGPRPQGDAVTVGPLQTNRGRLYYDVTLPIARAAGAPASVPPAYVRVRSFIGTSSSTFDVVQRLMGSAVAVTIGSPDTGVWTNLRRVVPAPAFDATDGAVRTYRDASGARRIGATTKIAGTPWQLLVDYREAAVVAPAWTFLWEMAATGALFLIGGGVLARTLTSRLTASLADLTAAAEDMAAGQDGAPVLVNRRDEVGRLGLAFNTMRERVLSTQAHLQRRAAELTESEGALHRQNAILESVLFGMTDGVIIADAGGRLVLLNKAAREMSGLALSIEDAPWGWRDSFRPRDAVTREPIAAAELPLTRAVAGEPSDDVEMLLGDPSSERLVRCYARPLRDESGAPAGGMVIIEDITERRRFVRELQANEARKEAVLRGSLDGVIRIDHSGAITAFNPAAERIFGYTRAEVLGRDVADVIIPARFRVQHRAGLARYLETRVSTFLGKRMEMPALRRDGSEFPAELSIIAITEDDEPIFSAFIRDLTGQKAAELARLRSVQLEEENRQVQEASRLKSEFLANMSHELRTPLNAIIGFAELLHDGRVTPDMPQFAEFLDDILTSGQHLLRLINDVLDLSKVEAGRLEFHPEDLDVESAIGEVVSVLRTTAAQKRIRVASTVDPAVRHVFIDRGRFKQVLYNYLSNALKFTPDGGRVHVAVLPEGDAMFRVEVQDTGIGIAPEDIARLFVEFNQLEAGASKQQQGTGLGLALTRRLAEAQGGQAGVRSVPGEGSTFHVVLPRRAQRGAAAAGPRSFPSAREGAPAILVIEDDPRDLDVLAGALAAAGYTVETASTGRDALAKLEAQTFDAITLDLLLPDTTGPEMLARIRAGTRNREVPVVVVTIVTENAAVGGFAVADILRKPIDAPELLEALRRAGVNSDRAGHVLVVDDDPGSLRLMAASLAQHGLESRCYERGADALASCAAAAPLAVVLDLQMPEMSGFEFAERFRRLPHCRGTPVIIWTVHDVSREDYERLRLSVQTIVEKGESGGAAVIAELRRTLGMEETA